MQSDLLFRTLGTFGVLGGLVVCAGCQQTYWVAAPTLELARRVQPATPAESVAVRARRQADGSPADEVYLRASNIEVAAARLGPFEPVVRVHAPNKRGKLVGGSILLGLGGAMVLGGIVMIGYGASISKRDSLGAGIFYGFSGLPLGVGVPLGLAGGVLLGRSRGPSDFVLPGEPGMTYLPP